MEQKEMCEKISGFKNEFDRAKKKLFSRITPESITSPKIVESLTKNGLFADFMLEKIRNKDFRYLNKESLNLSANFMQNIFHSNDIGLDPAIALMNFVLTNKDIGLMQLPYFDKFAPEEGVMGEFYFTELVADALINEFSKNVYDIYMCGYEDAEKTNITTLTEQMGNGDTLIEYMVKVYIQDPQNRTESNIRDTVDHIFSIMGVKADEKAKSDICNSLLSGTVCQQDPFSI